IDTTSYLQSAASSFTRDTICLGVSVGPDGNDRASVCPVTRNFTELPPTSMTSTLLTEDPGAALARSCCIVAPLDVAACNDFGLMALARLLQRPYIDPSLHTQCNCRRDGRRGPQAATVGDQPTSSCALYLMLTARTATGFAVVSWMSSASCRNAKRSPS